VSLGPSQVRHPVVRQTKAESVSASGFSLARCYTVPAQSTPQDQATHVLRMRELSEAKRKDSLLE
jgi:hypothetical protein